MKVCYALLPSLSITCRRIFVFVWLLLLKWGLPTQHPTNSIKSKQLFAYYKTCLHTLKHSGNQVTDHPTPTLQPFHCQRRIFWIKVPSWSVWQNPRVQPFKWKLSMSYILMVLLVSLLKRGFYFYFSNFVWTEPKVLTPLCHQNTSFDTKNSLPANFSIL